MKTLSKFIFIILLSLIATSVYAQPPTLVVTEKTTEMQFQSQINLIGRTKGIIESNIVAEISGRVQSIQTTEGTKVTKDQVLLTIDSEPISLLLQAKKAEALQTDVQAKLASGQKVRAEQLRRDKLISESALDSAIAWDAIQSANNKRTESEKRQLEIDFANTRIKAPYAGYTGKRLVDIGAWVTPGLPVFEMVDISKLKIIVDLPEKYFGQLKIGSSVIVQNSSNDNSLNGLVVGISPSASATTHTYPVIIEIENKDETLASGMLVRITLSLNKEFTSVAVPKDAIIRQGNKTLVYTIIDGKASPIPVTVKATKGAMLAVDSPMLTLGTEIIIRGNERVYPGAPVKTGEEKPPEDSQQTDSTNTDGE